MAFPYEVFLIAFGVAGVAWLFAARNPRAARALWAPGDRLLLVFRLAIGGLTIYVLLTAGGIAWFLGLAAAFFGGLHLYFRRPDEDLGFGTPFFIRPFAKLMNRLERLLFGY
jgi:FtsH-binding integral membrane protein